MDDERELKDRRYSLYFLLNSDEEQLPLDSCRCGDLASSSFPSSPVYSWSSSSPASRSQSVSPTPTTAASTSTTAFAPPRSCFQQDWGSSQPYYYHTYQSGGTSTVDEVVTQPCRDKSLLQFKEKIESALKSQHHHRRTQESSSPSPNNNNVNDNAERPRPSASSSRRSRQRSPSTSSAIPPAYSLSSPTALPHLPGQSSFLYCRKKITRKQSKKRLTPERRTVFYNCRVFEDGRQLHYTRDNKLLLVVIQLEDHH
ncbi:uncharacterized protein ACA1_219470 [Acanthamoeba castellanii str. Neff]|uniref:Uncharacterized protein n=1 Tax=Acanthamoeba castellanii (strain ATCC 30010 / Neff) TaxID=1257118 RepID=L8GQQ3_ACACF|nr:uncharacterized protein ACA1_219470 [Acanthamoeba castellanii str. Neff]ELR15232.1 hypothetical protein ACA1_219470 [Acanthamoeba castellanii str. Neff]